MLPSKCNKSPLTSVSIFQPLITAEWLALTARRCRHGLIDRPLTQSESSPLRCRSVKHCPTRRPAAIHGGRRQMSRNGLTTDRTDRWPITQSQRSLFPLWLLLRSDRLHITDVVIVRCRGKSSAQHTCLLNITCCYVSSYLCKESYISFNKRKMFCSFQRLANFCNSPFIVILCFFEIVYFASLLCFSVSWTNQ